MLTTIGFDADDTLWQNEAFFRLTQDRFAELAGRSRRRPIICTTGLLAAERRNLGHYGFGVKGFTLSMIETAIEVTEARVPAAVIAEIMAAGREMLAHPIELLPHAREAVTALAQDYRVLVDHQGRSAGSGTQAGAIGSGRSVSRRRNRLGQDRRRLFRASSPAMATAPARAMMVGNSLKSDVLPVLEAGGWGVHVPHRSDLGAGTCRGTAGSCPVSAGQEPWRIARSSGRSSATDTQYCSVAPH